MGDAKRLRQAEARFNAQLKRARETNSLALAALRAAAAHSILHDELTAQRLTGLPFGEAHGAALQSMDVNAASRAGTMLTLFYASLNVVIEGWQTDNQAKPQLSDPVIDSLLDTDFPKALRDYRNSMMHPNALDDSRLIAFAANHSQIAPWAAELVFEFQRFFREWRRSLSPGPA